MRKKVEKGWGGIRPQANYKRGGMGPADSSVERRRKGECPSAFWGGGRETQRWIHESGKRRRGDNIPGSHKVLKKKEEGKRKKKPSCRIGWGGGKDTDSREDVGLSFEMSSNVLTFRWGMKCGPRGKKEPPQTRRGKGGWDSCSACTQKRGCIANYKKRKESRKTRLGGDGLSFGAI